MEKIKLGLLFKEALRQTVNLFVGLIVLSVIITTASLVVGVACRCIQSAFNLGYNLW